MKKILLAIVLVLGICLSVKEKRPDTQVNFKKLIHGVIKKENPKKNIFAVGDKHLHNKAYGLLQIRAPYLSDANKIAGRKEIRRLWGKNKLTLQDMKNRKKAEWVLIVYLSHYGKRYTKETGKIPNVEVYARIHNGGPDGWKNKKTLDYGKIVVKYVRANRV